MVALGGFFEKKKCILVQAVFCWTLAENTHVIYHATFEGGSGGVGGQGENKASACFGSATEFSENSTRNPFQYSTAEIRREKGCGKRRGKKSEKF